MKSTAVKRAERVRCPWVGADDRLMIDYHDREWGRPTYEDRLLFELLILEGAQAGLSWSTVLRKRDAYRELFAGFEPRAVAKLTDRHVARFLTDSRIIRHEGKIRSAVSNARAFIDVQKEHGSFAAYLWEFVNGAPVQNRFRSLRDYPPRTELSDRVSRDLKKRGFTFVGSTICYAYLQATGVVNDHSVDCYLHGKVFKTRRVSSAR